MNHVTCSDELWASMQNEHTIRAMDESKTVGMYIQLVQGKEKVVFFF